MDTVIGAVAGFLKDWLGGQIAWIPSPQNIALVTTITQVLKKALEMFGSESWFSNLSHGWGPKILNALVAFFTVIITATQDGSPIHALDAMTAIAAFVVTLGLTWGGSDLFYKIVYDWLKLLPRNNNTNPPSPIPGVPGPGGPGGVPIG